MQHEIDGEPDSIEVPPFSAICFLGETYASGRTCCRRRCVVSDNDEISSRASGLRSRELSFEHLLDHVPNESARGCILLQVRMAGLCGPCLSTLSSALPVIVLTGFFDIPTVVRAIKAGADDFLLKPVSSDQLLRAVGRAIARYDATLGAKGALNIVRSRIATLTPREREVFELVIRGATNKHAARSLGCTERTVKAHRHRMMEKMQVRSVPELVSLAERVGVTSGNGHSALSHLASFSSAFISKACSAVEQHTKTREDADYEVKST